MSGRGVMISDNLAATLQPYRHYRRWWIAYSGGVDSHVLLHAVAQLCKTLATPPQLVALHINHQLNPRAADWVAHCRNICATLDVELIVETVNVARAAGAGLEAAARTARYAAFQKHLGTDQLLLQAHHRDDQTETLLLRLLRGSGLKGLAAIPARRALSAGKGGAGELLRPLLQNTRAEIMAYAQQQQLHWIHDDSNDNSAFDRNFLRLRVLPLLAERWPSYRDTLQRVTDNAAEAAELLTELAALDFAAVVNGQGLSIASCLKLSLPRQRNLIFYWLQQQQLPPPSSEQLAQVLTIFAARDDAQPCVSWPGAELRRFRGYLYASKPLPALPDDFDLAWRPAEPLAIGGCGILRASLVGGGGLRADREYHVRNRRGGERCQPQGRAHSQTLKKLLQEHTIEPWLRDRLPLIYCGDAIAAVADLWVCEGFSMLKNGEGWCVEWVQPG